MNLQYPEVVCVCALRVEARQTRVYEAETLWPFKLSSSCRRDLLSGLPQRFFSLFVLGGLEKKTVYVAFQTYWYPISHFFFVQNPQTFKVVGFYIYIYIV